MGLTARALKTLTLFACQMSEHDFEKEIEKF
jgi:hypothetical protein